MYYDCSLDEAQATDCVGTVGHYGGIHASSLNLSMASSKGISMGQDSNGCPGKTTQI